MAATDLHSSDNKEQELDDLTTCCICTETYTDPKALPCIHTFCMKCLQDIGLKTNKGPGDEMPCPICRRMFKIPPDGFCELPKHFFIERLIQVSKVSETSTASNALCSVCFEESKEQEANDTPSAKTYCVECKHQLCEECCNEHMKFKATKNHKLMPINEYETGKNRLTDLASKVSNVCEVHEQKPLDIFCADCKAAVCATCFVEEHDNHEGSHVSKRVDEFRRKIRNNTQVMNWCIAEAQAKMAELVKAKEEMQRSVELFECDVEKRKDEIKQLTDKHSSDLLQSLHSEIQSKLKEIQMATEDINTCISNLESYNSYCQRIMGMGSDINICSELSDLSIRAFELQQACQPIVERGIQNFKFRFRQSEIEELLEEGCGNLIGEIEDEHRCNFDRIRPTCIGLVRKAVEEGKKSIRGLAILDKELFILNEGSSIVQVYNLLKLNFTRRWNMTELNDPWDMGSCNRNKCLYVLDYKEISQSKEILRVDPNGNLIKKWSIGNDMGCGLSVTDELNVIVTTYWENKLFEYSPDGQLIREINLSSRAGIRRPLHGIKLSNGCFIVSHVDRDLQRVCIVDTDGKFKKSFGSRNGQLNDPVYLLVDGNEFVMVVDRGKSRVLLLDSDLEFKGEILSKESHGLLRPERILLDKSNDRLFLVDNDSNNPHLLSFSLDNSMDFAEN